MTDQSSGHLFQGIVVFNPYDKTSTLIFAFSPFKAVGGLWAVSKVERSARVRLAFRGFILLGRFSDSLLVVLILVIVYDCHL